MPANEAGTPEHRDQAIAHATFPSLDCPNYIEPPAQKGKPGAKRARRILAAADAG
jgi:hypothetical protein